MRPHFSKTSDEIYQDLCLKIEKLEYMPGEKLSENELCRIYDVTRHVIRNALSSLKQRKLVEVYPQRGTYVSLIDMHYISDILFMREAAEQEAFARVLELTDEDKAKLTERLRMALTSQSSLKKDAPFSEQFYIIDQIFHTSLLDAIGMPHVMDLIADSYIHIRRWRNFEIRSEERLREILQEHENIIKAIENNDREGGRKCLHLHLDTVSRYSKPLKEKEAQYFVTEE